MSKDAAPEEFLPDGPVVLADYPVCPGCGREFDQAILEYTGIEYDGDTWHLACAFADSDTMETVDPPRRCGNCHAFSQWRPAPEEDDRAASDPTLRYCEGCGWPFSEGPTKTEVLGGPDGDSS